MLTLFFDGIAYGMLLFILAVGLSVTMGLMNFINLAHGAFAMVGGYLTVVLMQRWDVPFLLCLPLAFAGAALTRLGFSHEDAVEVRGVGGLWSAGELLAEPFQRVLARRYPAAVFALSEAEPLEGAVRLACRGTSEALNS